MGGAWVSQNLYGAGVVQLVELDGPFVKLRLTGRFWHERSMVLARVANYLQKRIPVSRVDFFFSGTLVSSCIALALS